MVTPSRLQHSPLGQVAERQMRMWAIGLDVLGRLEDEEADAPKARQCKPYVCVSRETGALGEEVAATLARLLSWQLLDRELIHFIAEHGHLSETMLRFVDEQRWNWLLDLFRGWTRQRTMNHAGYILRLGEVLLTATQHAPSVIVGRGARYLLPPEMGLTVRVVAPHETRVKNLMAEHGFNADEAGTHLTRTDADRDDFVRRFFFHDPCDVHLYDLVINTESVPPAAAASLIAAECRRRFGETPVPTAVPAKG